MMTYMLWFAVQRQSTCFAHGILTLFVFGLSCSGVFCSEPELHWSFHRPTRPEPPARESFDHAARIRNPIDQFVLQRLQAWNPRRRPTAQR